MPLTASIDAEEPQASGRYVRARFVAADGTVFRRRWWAADGEDAEAVAQALASRVEAQEHRRELDTALNAALNGIDPHALTFRLVTTSQMRVYVLKSIANLVREGDFSRVAELRLAKQMLDRFTDAQIASQLDGVSEAAVSAWRTKLATLVSGMEDYDPGFPEQERG